MKQPRTIEQQWQSFAKIVLHDAGPTQLAAMKAAFFGGIHSILTEMLGPVADLPEEDGMKQLDTWMAEGIAFAQSIGPKTQN